MDYREPFSRPRSRGASGDLLPVITASQITSQLSPPLNTNRLIFGTVLVLFLEQKNNIEKRVIRFVSPVFLILTSLIRARLNVYLTWIWIPPVPNVSEPGLVQAGSRL